MDNNIASLVQELRFYDNEKPWIEFKHNNYDPEMIAEHFQLWQIVRLLNLMTLAIWFGVFTMKHMKL